MEDLPMPVYIGDVLKKDLTPKKKHETAAIYGNREITLHKSTQS